MREPVLEENQLLCCMIVVVQVGRGKKRERELVGGVEE